MPVRSLVLSEGGEDSSQHWKGPRQDASWVPPTRGSTGAVVKLPVNFQVENILGFVGHMVPATTAKVYCHSLRATIDST